MDVERSTAAGGYHDVRFAPLAARSAAGSPERALWAAIVGDAVSICQGRTPASPAEATAARRWIADGNARFGGFSWCCDLLGLDGDAIRERVLRLRWSPHC